MATNAAVARWLDAHVGATIVTTQVAPRHPQSALTAKAFIWSPGPRVLAKTGRGTWSLDGSEVRLTTGHVAVSVSDEAVTIEWREEDDSIIHTTTYEVSK